MLKRLLKYDLKSIFKYWWIGAITTVGAAILGGFCINILESERSVPQSLEYFVGMMLVIVVLCFVAFAIMSEILMFVRFYKNLFTDEGYLTFTLPVKRSEILNSKLIMSIFTMFVTCAVLVADIIIMLFIGYGNYIFTAEFWQEISIIINEILEATGIYAGVYILEIIALSILLAVFSNLFLFCCITFAAVITKKARIITAIGIYYGASSVFSFVMQMFYIFGIAGLTNWFSDLPQGAVNPVISVIALTIIVFFGMLCGLMYTLQYWMLDRKLNLS